MTKALFELPNKNTIILYQTGDSFKDHVLPRMLYDSDLVIATPAFVRHRYKDVKNAISTHRLKQIQDTSKIKRIIIDTRLPRSNSKMFDELKRICKDKVIILVQPITDYEMTCDFLTLLTLTREFKVKNNRPKLQTLKYNQYVHRQFIRGY